MKKLDNAFVTDKSDCRIAEFDWGRLTWLASGDIGNSDKLTVGKCEIKPGMENPFHSHPNCDEILHVLSGRIAHTVGVNQKVEMEAGDTISVPPNVKHNARNIGPETAVLMVCFSSAHRETKGE